MDIAIIGAGAAGYFAAIQVKENFPEAKVVIFEKSNKVLSKVKVSGGGRCNVTNAASTIRKLLEGYPRGRSLMKKNLKRFSNHDMVQWLADHGVKTHTESDGRIFPISNTSQTIIDCFTQLAVKHRIELREKSKIEKIESTASGIHLQVHGKPLHFDKCIVAAGGTPKLAAFDWLKPLQLKVEPPVPSLFTFNIQDQELSKLMGLSVPNAIVSIQSTKLKSSGPLLITHWGISGPAVLQLSAFGARILADKEYRYTAQVNWVGQSNQSAVDDEIIKWKAQHGKKKLINAPLYQLPARLWAYMLHRCEVSPDLTVMELPKKARHKLINLLCNDIYPVKGKTTFKEEFVTCGGVSIESINPQSMASLLHPNVYFAGEILDIDGVTGGYNFQVAWTTAYVAAQLK